MISFSYRRGGLRLIIKNCHLRKREGLWNLYIEKGVFSRIVETDTDSSPACAAEGIDMGGRLLAAPFVEPHIHLDYVFTAGYPRNNESGSLFEAIEIWADRKKIKPFTAREIQENAKKAVQLLVQNGIQFIRTHVDVSDENLLALQAIAELKESFRDRVDIEIVAFPQQGIYAYPDGDKLLEEALHQGADVIGGIPHYEFTREEGVQSVRKIMELAVRYGKKVDVHCDETDDEQSRFLEVLAAEAYKTGLGPLVTASHTTAMHSYNNAYTYKLFQLLKKSGIHFVSCPAESIHLQGRFDTYPKRRGITRVKELHEAGMNVCFAQDSIMDPWYPLGSGNIMRILDMGLHTCQMMGHSEISTALDFISDHAAKLIGIEDSYGIAEGKPANFIVLDAHSEFDAIRLLSPVLLSVRNGKVIYKREETTPIHLYEGSLL
ncbi:cytosine deaminase [Bacillus coagulans]|uniref:cytosine deaminase n=1 Tax=Heyndrickxia coagulans TaxID=1398 RepID=UPI0013787E77|nr:cytosine deaminase [Heyndrickxia coagulans]MDT9757005.1 cytosine deaminase [Heyndrickxia coagulans]NCG69277.1 cytosine deaminase [Heyndrickxia coagulans]